MTETCRAVLLPARAGPEPEDEQDGASDRAEENACAAVLPRRLGAELDALGRSGHPLRLPGSQVEQQVPRGLVAVGGVLLERAMRVERITRGEVEAAVRRTGHGSFDDIAAVVLETDGELSVIARSDEGDGSTLRSVVG